MKVFVTGSEGFVGKHLAVALRAKGIDIHTVDITGHSRLNHHVGDIRRPEIADIIPEGADAIIHLAGLVRTRDGRNKAYECFDVNVMGTLNLINAAEEKKAKQFIFASSETVYGEWKDGTAKNDGYLIDTQSLISEYALSKLVSEANLRQKFNHGFCPVTILRFGVIYGPRENNWSAMESLFNDVRTKEEVRAGSLETGRCFVHVDDIVSGIISSLGLGGFNIIDLQGDKFITLGDIIETSKRILGKNPKVIQTSPGNHNVRRVTNAKAKAMLKWQPQYDLNKGLNTLMTG